MVTKQGKQKNDKLQKLVSYLKMKGIEASIVKKPTFTLTEIVKDIRECPKI